MSILYTELEFKLAKIKDRYMPIYGINRFQITQSYDSIKVQTCLERNIDLSVIDVSKQKRFKPENSQEYLNIILNKINERLTQE